MNSFLRFLQIFNFRGRAFIIRLLSKFNHKLNDFKFYLFENYPIHINLSDDTAINLFLNKGLKHELGLSKLLLNIVNENIVFWDIGSNYGFYPYLLSNKTSCNKIYCFEPNPKTFNLLSKTCSNLQGVNCFNYGIGKSYSKLDFYYCDHRSDLGSFSKNANYLNVKKKKIEIKSIDFSLESIELPHIIKIDVEGFEIEVLKGFKKLNKVKPVVILEWIESIQHKSIDYLNKFFKSNYNRYFIGNDSKLYTKKNIKCSADVIFIPKNHYIYNNLNKLIYD